jgi:threonine dehydrogenase-like Zn-dependent dehydrogenase
VKYGYSNVGTVVTGPPELVGCQTFCLYPHQDAYVVDTAALLLLPAGVPASRAVLAANMETALNAVWDAQLKAGDRVAVIGAGTVGALAAYLAAQHPGTEVELIDIDARKEELARALGIGFASPKTARSDADVVLHASGSASGLQNALRLAGREATVLELSWYGTQSVTLELGGEFHAKRLSIRSSQVGNLPPAQLSRWSPRRRLELALGLLEDPRLDALIDAHVPFSELPDGMQRLASGELRATCLRIDY